MLGGGLSSDESQWGQNSVALGALGKRDGATRALFALCGLPSTRETTDCTAASPDQFGPLVARLCSTRMCRKDRGSRQGPSGDARTDGDCQLGLAER